MQELTQNLWERYGFSANPFDTRALSLSQGAWLSVNNAYVSRKNGSAAASVLTNFFRNPGGGRITVEGEPGVGKTTFVNYHRHQWESEATDKLLTPATEISMQEYWEERDFLLNMMSALMSRLRLDLGEKRFSKDLLMQEITAICGVLITKEGGFSIGGQALGTGVSIGKTSNKKIQIGDLTNHHLRQYFSLLVQQAKKQKNVVGVTFHFNNLELLGQKGPQLLRLLFEKVRDVLQEPDVYFIFVGYKGMFQQVIVPSERVRSIFFDTPVYLNPLDIEEIESIIERRYELLALPDKKWIRPVEDRVVQHLHKMFNGKIRYVMNAITTLINRIPESYSQPLGVEKAMEIISSLLTSELRKNLPEEGARMFFIAIKLGRFTNSSLVKKSGKSKQSINKYIQLFLRYEYIHLSEAVGRNRFYEIDPRFLILAKS
jgi:Cdc6-like AAA superfamily ATPase